MEAPPCQYLCLAGFLRESGMVFVDVGLVMFIAYIHKQALGVHADELFNNLYSDNLYSAWSTLPADTVAITSGLNLQGQVKLGSLPAFLSITGCISGGTMTHIGLHMCRGRGRNLTLNNRGRGKANGVQTPRSLKYVRPQSQQPPAASSAELPAVKAAARSTDNVNSTHSPAGTGQDGAKADAAANGHATPKKA